MFNKIVIPSAVKDRASQAIPAGMVKFSYSKKSQSDNILSDVVNLIKRL